MPKKSEDTGTGDGVDSCIRESFHKPDPTPTRCIASQLSLEKNDEGVEEAT